MNLDSAFYGHSKEKSLPPTGSLSQLTCSKSFSRRNRISSSPTPLLRLNSIGEVSNERTCATPQQHSSSMQWCIPFKNIPQQNLSKLRLSKSLSLPEVSNFPQSRMDLPNGCHPSLSSSFDSSVFHNHSALDMEASYRNQETFMNDRVVPSLVKNLVLEAMQSSSKTKNGSFFNKTLDILAFKANLEHICEASDNSQSYFDKDKIKKLKLRENVCHNSKEVSEGKKFKSCNHTTDSEKAYLDSINLSQDVKNCSINKHTPFWDTVISPSQNEQDSFKMSSASDSEVLEENTSKSTTDKPRIDRTSVLFQRKNCTKKKGRPSSRKRVKRQREKERQSFQNTNEDFSRGIKISPPSKPTTLITSSPTNSSPSVVFSNNSICDISFDGKDSFATQGSSSINKSTEPDIVPKCVGLAAQFFMFYGDSDSFSSSDSEAFLDSDDSWCDSEDNFSPSKSLNSVEHFDEKFDISNDDDSIIFSISPKSSDINNISEDGNNIVFSSSPLKQIMREEKEPELSIIVDEVDLKKVNAKWLKYYPNLCSRNDQSSKNTDNFFCKVYIFIFL